MKKTRYLAIVLFMVLMAAWGAEAQMMGGGRGMMGEPGEQQGAMPQAQEEESFMMHPGMMGCYGMGPGMMGGYGMGPGMMGGYGMGLMKQHMMAEYGSEPGMKPFRSPEQYEKFLDATRDMRKKMHDLRFEYGEMMRNPATTMGDLKKKEQEMMELRRNSRWPNTGSAEM
ncbi:MAG TPA: hypothetical protein ENN06_05230 [Desulfobacteraceae bacterium]|nr:hypothetical protein [Desulfobacteraceae bacterium]